MRHPTTYTDAETSGCIRIIRGFWLKKPHCLQNGQNILLPNHYLSFFKNYYSIQLNSFPLHCYTFMIVTFALKSTWMSNNLGNASIIEKLDQSRQNTFHQHGHDGPNSLLPCCESWCFHNLHRSICIIKTLLNFTNRSCCLVIVQFFTKYKDDVK